MRHGDDSRRLFVRLWAVGLQSRYLSASCCSDHVQTVADSLLPQSHSFAKMPWGNTPPAIHDLPPKEEASELPVDPPEEEAPDDDDEPEILQRAPAPMQDPDEPQIPPTEFQE